MTIYDECRQEYMSTVLHEFKKKKLKLQNGDRVKSKRQAIAIALSMAQRKCRIGSRSLKAIEKKVIKFLTNDTRKISSDRIPLTNVIETRLLVKNLLKDGKKARANKYEKLLLARIKKANKKGIFVTENIKKELRKISRMLRN
jgi:hypothetical protein